MTSRPFSFPDPAPQPAGSGAPTPASAGPAQPAPARGDPAADSVPVHRGVVLTRGAVLLPLFLVSAGLVGFENALTRYFAVAKWSEYGYWVISIVMAGLALSGVAAALLRDLLVRHGGWLRAALPPLLVLAAAAGFHFTARDPFNPLELQNPATWLPQLGNIALYYAALLPFFFLAGLYIAVSFLLNAGEVGRVYGYDLLGAGAGSALALGLMYLLHPFLLVPALLVPLAAAALFQPGRRSWIWKAAAVLALLGGEALLLLGPQPAISDFKAVYAPLQTPGAKVVAEVRSPRGHYQLLQDFTERVDTDVSNNSGQLGVPGPPATLGLYRDGDRVASAPKGGLLDVRYSPAALAAGPYAVRPAPRVLLVGASGGFRIAEALGLGARHVTALEPEPVLRRALVQGLGPALRFPADPRVRISGDGPVPAALAAVPGAYDLVDISADFLDAAPANANGFTAEAIAAYLRAVSPDGIVSIPVSIRDFPVYALRLLATARAGLLQAGVRDPSAHVVVYRSAWGVRILLSPAPFDAPRLTALRRFCEERSFDLSYYPGIDVRAARAGLYNDLPAVSFTTGRVSSTGPADAIADEAQAVLAGKPTPSRDAFNLAPITLDQPYFYAVLNLWRLDTVLRRIEILPQAEVGGLVNVAVLLQAIVLALLVLAVPWLAPGRVRAEGGGGRLWPLLYFPALGLGFLFIEIFLIETAAFYLGDRTTAFALVLTVMLVFSGLGSLVAGRMEHRPQLAVILAVMVVLAWLGLLLARGEQDLLATLGLPWLQRAGLVLAVTAPVSFALGMPFPLGLARAGPGGALPWAWGLNGAFSVIATPLANLIAREAGLSRLLAAAAILYLVVAVALPAARRSPGRAPV